MWRWKLWQPVVIAALALLPLGALAAFGFIKSGLYNVAAAKPHTKLTFWVTNETMIRSVKRHAQSVEPPAQFTAAQVVRGFCAYEAHCVACHGAAGVPASLGSAGWSRSRPGSSTRRRNSRPPSCSGSRGTGSR